MHPGAETIHEIQFTRYEIRKFWVVLIADFTDWAGFFILAGIAGFVHRQLNGPSEISFNGN